MTATLLIIQTLNGIQLGVLLFLIAAGLTLITLIYAQKPFRQYSGVEYRMGDIALPPGGCA